jgi:hypothetical protein
MLKLKQFSMTLEDVFTLNDLRGLWGCTGSEVVIRLLEEAEIRYGKELRVLRESSG